MASHGAWTSFYDTSNDSNLVTACPEAIVQECLGRGRR